jgi:hypothetical protein
MKIGPIESDEIKLAKFDFTDEVDASATLTSPTVVCTVHKGTDPTPANVLVGSPVVSGKEVHQKVQPGVVGVTYKLRTVVTDSSGLKHGMTGLLEVVQG